MRQLAKAGLATPNSTPTAISDAQGAVARVTAMANSYVDHINAIGAAARSMANNIDAGRCSGARIGTWVPPVSHVRLRRPAQAVLLGGCGKLVGELVGVEASLDLVQVGDPGSGLDLARQQQRAAILVG